MNIVLHEPEIPFNTGAIGRTCVATNTKLHLIKPYGFILNDKNIKKAGMDYWPLLQLKEYLSYEDFLRSIEEENKHGNSDSFHEAVQNKQGKDEPGICSGLKSPSNPKIWYATTKAKRSYTEVSFSEEDYIMFGKESAGIPEEILVENEEHCIRIPMLEEARSLNLSNSVAVILYEALRQQDFNSLKKAGELHRLHWK